MNLRRIIFIGLIVLFGFILITHFVDAAELVSTLQRGQPLWVFTALAIHLLWLLNQTALYQALYRLVNLPARISHLLPIVLSSNFINFSTPSASLGAVMLFLNDARQRGLDSGRVVLVNFLFVLLNLIWFALILAFGLAMLFVWHDLKLYQVITAAILLTNVTLLISGLVLAGWQPKLLERLLLWGVGLINSISQLLLKRNLFKVEQATEFSNEFSQAAAALNRGGRRLGKTLFHTFWVDVLDMAVLYACLRAFPAEGTLISPAVLIAGYSIGVLFVAVAITPQGIGVVEGAMTAAFVSLGVPVARATIAVLAYRGISFWFPLLSGFIALRWVRGLGK